MILKTYLLDIITPNKTNSFLLILILLPSFFVSLDFQTFSHANASGLGESIEQFQNNLQSNIDKQVQSSTNNNNNNCDSNNNISIQSQTNNNGQTTSTSRTSCGVSTSTTSALSVNNANLTGAIVSAEYNTTTGIIVNSLFGNWSFTARDGGSNDFNSSFTKQPIFYNSNSTDPTTSTTDTSINNIIAPNANNNNNNFTSSTNNGAIPSVSSSVTGSNDQTGSMVGRQQDSNLTSYTLSNFRTNTINQLNFDTIFQGIIDVVKEVKSLDADRPDETNTFKDANASISILGNRTLVINFGNQTSLFEEFKNIPLVGIVK
jgi:hypothetical protein